MAGVQNEEALIAIRAAIDRALANGTTLEEFRRDLRDIMDRTGITLRGNFGWRSRTIFQTNLRTAYAAGRWEQIQRLKDARPYLRYEAVLDHRTRPQHRAWHGTVLPVDHEFWRTHYPPNGWGCRCTVRSLSERDLRRYGYTVTDPPPPSGSLPRSVRTPAGNRIVELPPGIDEGWDHNVGEAAFGSRIDQDIMDAWRARGEADWEPLPNRLAPPPGPPAPLPPVPADPPRAGLGERLGAAQAVAAALRRVIGGEAAAIATPIGTTVHVLAAALAEHINPDRSPWLTLLPELISDPFEIWGQFQRNRLTGRVVLRQRLIKVVRQDKERALLLIAQAIRGRLEAWTFIPMRPGPYVDRQREGTLLYRRVEDPPS